MNSVRPIFALIAIGLSSLLGQAASPTCDQAKLSFTSGYFIGSSLFYGGTESGSAYCWLTNGASFASGLVGEDLLLNFDATVNGANGETPGTAPALQYAAGKWASGLALPAAGKLQYSRTNNLHLDQGTIEMWVALRADGTNVIYTNQDHTLFHYKSAGTSDYMRINQSKGTGIINAGGSVSNQWESAYGGGGYMQTWVAGEWHHLAFTFSAPQNFMRFYVDGVKVAENNEGHYWMPAGDGAVFSIGGNLSGTNAHYYLDAVRISSRVTDAAELKARVNRSSAMEPNEVWLSATNISPGDSLVFEYTPVTPAQTGPVCQSAPSIYPGIPIINPQPPSTILPPGTTQLDLSVQTVLPGTCAYALGQPLAYARMTPFSQGAGTTNHQTRITGLSTDPNVVNDIYLRCASYPDYPIHLQYRAYSEANPPYPRTGNLWGWSQWQASGLTNCAKVDLWLGVALPPGTIRSLRLLNPHIRILTSINCVENSGLPDDYYLKGTNGSRVEVWPGSYRLNLTKNYVAEYQAQFAYQTMLDSGMMADGVFFDNVMTTQSWQNHDIYGNPVALDANEDGIPDDPAVLDAAWKAGVFHEIQTFRQLMPYAIVSGHSLNITEPGIADLFNGISFGFRTADVIEGKLGYSSFATEYQTWFSQAVQPVTVMIESSPTDQIAYGYGYSPIQQIPAATLEFARTYYPWVRFGLATALMGDGYFAQEYGDTWHGNFWWYDELDFNLGYPLGPMRRVELAGFNPTNSLVNGSFESSIVDPWRLGKSGAATATVTRATAGAAAGTACARLDITYSDGTDWHLDLSQWNRLLVKGTTYDMIFYARSSVPRAITLSSQKGSADWRNYGLSQKVNLTTNWQEYTATFMANETVADARIQFFVGATNSTVWLDDVRLQVHPADVYRRDFNRGIALLNASRQTQSVALEPGLRRLAGTQAPRYEFILDNTDASFSTTGIWTNTPFDSGNWTAIGPFYHGWAGTTQVRTSATGEAQWAVPIAADDIYTLSAWWPAAAAATNWTHSASFAIVSGGVVVAMTNLDQSTGGDQWHPLATLPLAASNATFVRITNTMGICVADAVHVTSAARYNDGQPAAGVLLPPMDGIILQRDTPLVLPPTINQVKRTQNTVELTVTNLTPGFTNELIRATQLGINDWQTISVFQPQNTTATLQDTSAANLGSCFYRVRMR